MFYLAIAILFWYVKNLTQTQSENISSRKIKSLVKDCTYTKKELKAQRKKAPYPDSEAIVFIDSKIKDNQDKVQQYIDELPDFVFVQKDLYDLSFRRDGTQWTRNYIHVLLLMIMGEALGLVKMEVANVDFETRVVFRRVPF